MQLHVIMKKLENNHFDGLVQDCSKSIANVLELLQSSSLRRHNERDSVSNHQRLYITTVCSDADHRKHQSSASLAFVWGTRRWPLNFPHKGPVTRKIFPFNDVIMLHEAIDSFYSPAASNAASNSIVTRNLSMAYWMWKATTCLKITIYWPFIGMTGKLTHWFLGDGSIILKV